MQTWNSWHFLIQGILILGFGLWAQKRLGLSLGSVIYLSLAPFLLWYKDQLWILAISLLMAIFIVDRKLGKKSLGWLPVLGLVALFVLDLRSGHLVDYPIQVINQLRGEHSAAGSLLVKLLHNKSEYLFFWLKNIEQQIGISKIYAQGNFRWVSPYYLMGFLYPWDLWLHWRILGKAIHKEVISPKLLIWFGLGLASIGLEPDWLVSKVFLIAFLSTLAIWATKELETLAFKRWLWLVSPFYILIQTYFIFNFLISA